MDKTVLRLEHVTGKGKKFHLEDIDLEVKAGYIYCLVGENGAGKTTLMKTILQEKKQYTGRILIEEEDIAGRHAETLRKIGFVSEDQEFLEDRTCMQNARILGGFYPDFDENGFASMMAEMKVGTGKIYKQMSRGEKLKFQLAFAAAHGPVLYLLDEVTVGMDPVFRQELFQILQRLIMEEQAAVLMTSHITSEAERKTDYTGVMKGGRLIAFGESSDIFEAERTGNAYGK